MRVITEVVRAACVADAWEQALVRVRESGRWVEHEEPDEQRFLESVGPCIIAIERPLSGHRYHRWILNRCLPQDLAGYIEEVCEGTKDHLIDLSDPNAWHYTYHQRLCRYPTAPGSDAAGAPTDEGGGSPGDQLGVAVEKLKTRPTSRRAQAITWVPTLDPHETHPPCLQRIWLTVRDGKLVMHTHWRSRDAYLAAFMNIIAVTELQRRLAERIGVEPGPYYDMTDSYHIYDRDTGEVDGLREAAGQARAEGARDRLWMTEEQFQTALEADRELRQARSEES
jgi:thymidylate synthase